VEWGGEKIQTIEFFRLRPLGEWVYRCLVSESYWNLIPETPPMKPLKSLLLIVALSAAQAYATIPGFFAASAAGDQDPDANGGTANAWSLTSGILFTGDSGTNAGGASGAGAGSLAWGLYSDNANATAEMFHFLNGALNVGQTLSLDFDNGWVDGGGVGLAIKDGSGANQFELLYLVGGPNYIINDSASSFDTGIGFTGDGFNVAFTLNDLAGNYTVKIGDDVFAGRTLANANPVEQVRVFNFQAGGDSGSANHNLYVNNLQIIPEPSTAMLFMVAGLAGLAFFRRKV